MENDITVILLNWRRRDNLRKIISTIKNQDIDFKLVLIDNASADNTHRFEDSVTSMIYIPKNNKNMCWERWVYSIECDSKYVCVLDDDLAFASNDVLSICKNYMDVNPDIDAVGYIGVQYDKKLGYFGSNHPEPNTYDIHVPIIKGRFMFVRSSSLIGLDMEPDLTCDDIKVSAHLNDKVILSQLRGKFMNMPEGLEAVFLQPGQKQKREIAVRKYF